MNVFILAFSLSVYCTLDEPLVIIFPIRSFNISDVLIAIMWRHEQAERSNARSRLDHSLEFNYNNNNNNNRTIVYCSNGSLNMNFDYVRFIVQPIFCCQLEYSKEPSSCCCPAVPLLSVSLFLQIAKHFIHFEKKKTI